MSDSRLFLIDANALCYRSYFAIKGLSTSYGQATNAVYGFVNTLKKILRDYEPKYLAVCFDVSKKTLRHERFAEYKVHRPSMPDDLVSQIPIIKEVVRAYNLPIFEMEGFEADDVIATIAKKFSDKDIEVVIVSGDKDVMQLLDKNVKIFHMRRDTIIGYKEAKESLGVDPKKIADYIGLAGDKTDNLPGVLGVGEVTARNLLNQFGSLEDIYVHLDEITSQKVQENLRAHKDKALFSKELALLDSDVPIKININMLKVSSPDTKRLLELYRKLEFRKFAEEYSAASPGKQRDAKLTTIKSVDEIKTLCSRIKREGGFTFLCDMDEEDQDVLFENFVVSLGGAESFQIPADKIIYLKEAFEDNDVIKITHDAKECMKVLYKNGLSIKGKIFDVVLAGYLLAPQSSYDIATLGWSHLKLAMSPQAGTGHKAYIVARLYKVMEKQLKERSLLKLFEEIEVPLSYVLFRMETEGVRIDEKFLSRLSKDCQGKIKSLVGKLYKQAGEEFNLNSPKQLSHVLFEKLKLPVVKRTKTGFSTDEGVLMKLAEGHPLPALILEYRQLAKLVSTYIDALPKLIDKKTKRVHASFNQAGTETGRLSSNNPNLQNIPIRTELGRQIRKAFIPSKDTNVIISADYSQIELRILAHLSNDTNLISAFKKDQDIHTYTAALVFDKKGQDVTQEMRNTAKRVNFGIIYGMSAFGLAKDLGISQQEAQEFIDRYFLRYPGVKKFMEREIKKGEKYGFVTTLLNRRRYLPEINSSNMGLRQFAQRQAINTPVQGSAADLIKLAMINIQEVLEEKSLQSKMIITVHDELVFDVTKKEKDIMVELIRHHMEHPMELSVPITVSIKIGKNWLDLKEV